MLKETVSKLFLPLFAFFILVTGMSLLNLIIPIKLEETGYSIKDVGYVAAFYYIGMLSAAFSTEKMIRKLGFINSYLILAIVFGIAVFFHSFSTNIALWVVLRLVVGFSIAALFIVVEGWCMVLSTPKNFARVMALYHIGYYGAYSFGQLSLDFTSVEASGLFYLISFLGLISIIPLKFIKSFKINFSDFKPLKLSSLFKKSPIAFFATFIAGMNTSVIYSLLPVYLNGIVKTSDVGSLMFLTIFSAMILQYPIGKLSDTIDKKLVLLFLCVLQIIVTLNIFFIQSNSIIVLKILLACLGGVCYTIYPLSLSILCEAVESDKIVAATQSIILVNGIGSILGPILAPLFVITSSQKGIFMFLATIAVICIPYTLWVMKRNNNLERESLPL